MRSKSKILSSNRSNFVRARRLLTFQFSTKLSLVSQSMTRKPTRSTSWRTSWSRIRMGITCLACAASMSSWTPVRRRRRTRSSSFSQLPPMMKLWTSGRRFACCCASTVASKSSSTSSSKTASIIKKGSALILATTITDFTSRWSKILTSSRQTPIQIFFRRSEKRKKRPER